MPMWARCRGTLCLCAKENEADEVNEWVCLGFIDWMGWMSRGGLRQGEEQVSLMKGEGKY